MKEDKSGKMSFLSAIAVTLPERTLLLKLFYENKGNDAAALRKFRLIKNLRKGPLLPQAIKRMIARLEKSRNLRVQPGRERKPSFQISLKMFRLLLLNNQWIMLLAVEVHVQYHGTWMFPTV